jgi:hypothetical protein
MKAPSGETNLKNPDTPTFSYIGIGPAYSITLFN